MTMMLMMMMMMRSLIELLMLVLLCSVIGRLCSASTQQDEDHNYQDQLIAELDLLLPESRDNIQTIAVDGFLDSSAPSSPLSSSSSSSSSAVKARPLEQFQKAGVDDLKRSRRRRRRHKYRYYEKPPTYHKDRYYKPTYHKPSYPQPSYPSYYRQLDDRSGDEYYDDDEEEDYSSSSVEEKSGHGDEKSGYGYQSYVELCPYVTNDFCYGRYAGHYSHPSSYTCFVQCDHVGTAYSMPCAYGTSWKSDGYEPAYGNMCQ